MPDNAKFKAISNSAAVMILKEVAEINGKFRKQEFRTRYFCNLWIISRGRICTDKVAAITERGARGSVVIEALCCKPEGRGFTQPLT
jgi:hypothetical protein